MYQNAKYDLDEAILIDPENWYAYYLRGVANMRLSSSKYSRTNEYAINDFSNSIALNSSNENGKSYYYRGKVYEFTNNDNSCSDFYQACEFNTLDSCEISDEICRPKTGFRPYDKIFGPGITSGDREFNVINNCEYDMVITIKDNRTRHSIRTEYVRSGEKLAIENIPNGWDVAFEYNIKFHVHEFSPNAGKRFFGASFLSNIGPIEATKPQSPEKREVNDRFQLINMDQFTRWGPNKKCMPPNIPRNIQTFCQCLDDSTPNAVHT